jgi:hypothetical protein
VAWEEGRFEAPSYPDEAAQAIQGLLDATMTESSPDVVLGVIDRLYSWHARRPGLTLFGAYFGRLVLTSHRLMFLSTGSNGILRALGFSVVGGLPAQLTLGETRTEELDTSALVNPGSLNLDLQRVARSEISRRWDFSYYLVIEVPRPDGSSRFVSFMTQYGLIRGRLPGFQESLERARTALFELPSRADRGSDNSSC